MERYRKGEKLLIFRLNKIGDMIDSVNCNWIHFNTPDDNKKTREAAKHNVLVKYCTIPHDDKKNWCRLTITHLYDEDFFKELLDVYR